MATIRRYTPDDLPTLKAMAGALHAIVRDFAPELPPPDAMLEDYFAYVLDRVETSSGTIFVAEEADGRLVGHCVLYGRIPPDRDEDPTPYSFIAELYVAPAGQGGGVGRALMSAAEAYARALGSPRIELGVVTDNSPARAFYERLGYAPRVLIYSKRLDERAGE